MTRWEQKFNNHNFLVSFDSLQTVVNDVNTKDITENQSILEFARLNETIGFIDSYIKLINPKLNSENGIQNVLNNANTHLNNAKSNFEYFLTHNYSLAHIKAANDHIDNIVSLIYQLRTVLPKVNSQGISAMFRQYSKTINSTLQSIDLETLEKSISKIYKLEEELLNDNQKISIKTKIDDMFNEMNDKKLQLEEYHSQIFEDTDITDSIQSKINDYKKDIEISSKNIKDNLIAVSSKIDELDKFYVKTFGTENDSKSSKKDIEKLIDLLNRTLEEQKDSFDNQINQKLEKIKQYEKEQQDNNKNLYEQIESLLPHATSTGLAKAFEVQREKFQKPIENWNKVFIISIAIMFFSTLSTYFTFDFANLTVSFMGNELGAEKTFTSLFNRLPIIAPLIWLAIYASKRRSENQRLEQEYAHKEALAKSYSSYKQQIDNLPSESKNLLEKLLDTAIDTISANASHSLDKKHGDGTPAHQLIEKAFEKFKTENDKK